MTGKINIQLFYIVSASFLLINLIGIVNNFYFINFLPFILAIALIGIFSMDKLMLMTVFATPLSVSFTELLGHRVSPDLSVPAEPMLICILILFTFKIIRGYKPDTKIMRHPITIVIILQLIWILFASLSSTMFSISIKFFTARLWLLVPAYLFAAILFKKKTNIKNYLWLYILPLTIVILYTIYQHSLFDYEERPANWVVKPFYNDHTSYAAMMAMFIPVLIAFVYMKSYNTTIRVLTFILVLIFVTAIVLSYTRAAWVSLAGALVMFLALKAKIKFRTIVYLFLSFVVFFAVFQAVIISKLEENKQDSSNDFGDHIESITNVSTDASNKERINRWNCAIRMFRSKPWLGFGPGTYSFQYAPYQKQKEKTIISTNFGDGGNAHSEYLGPLAEQGLAGMLLMLLLVFTILATGTRLYYSINEPELKLLVCGLLIGLVTYFVHGVLNNFLDTDKASIPFWGFASMLMAIDIYHHRSTAN